MLKTLSLILMASITFSLSVSAADKDLVPKIAFSSKFRSVDYLFTENAEKQAVMDGSDYNTAIREVGWDLISAVGRACDSVKNVQAVFIDRINYKDRHSFVVRGVMADLKFQSLSFESPLPNSTLKELIIALEKEKIKVTNLDDTRGVEVRLAEK